MADLTSREENIVILSENAILIEASTAVYSNYKFYCWLTNICSNASFFNLIKLKVIGEIILNHNYRI